MTPPLFEFAEFGFGFGFEGFEGLEPGDMTVTVGFCEAGWLGWLDGDCTGLLVGFGDGVGEGEGESRGGRG